MPRIETVTINRSDLFTDTLSPISQSAEIRNNSVNVKLEKEETGDSWIFPPLPLNSLHIHCKEVMLLTLMITWKC